MILLGGKLDNRHNQVPKIGTPELKDINNTEQLSSKYTLLDLIGSGGMAEVYRAKLVGTGGFEKPLVIKQLLADVAGDGEVVANFIDEARLAALLQHENIACVYDFGEEEGHYFIAMEYLFGKDLHTTMAQAKSDRGTIGINQALFIAAQICAGMDYAHNLKDMQQQPLNIIHRDLTPHNVFLTYEGKVKIIDFGVAKAELFDNRTRAGVVKGKVTYMSPEQLVEGDVDSRSDIFSIGILLYEMLSGVRMYQGDTATLIRKCINVEHLPFEEVLPGEDPVIYKILGKALQKDKEKRYQSCGEMLDDINEYFFEQGVRPDNRMVKTLLLELFQVDHDAEIQRLSPVDNSGNTRVSTVVLDDDKTIFVEMPFPAGGDWKPGFNRNSLLVGFAALFCIIAMAYVKMAFTTRQNNEEQVIVEELQPTVVLRVPEPERKPVVQITPLQIPVEPEVIVEKELNDEDIMARAVGIFMEKAEKALGENRLTLPEEDSAFGYYKKVLELDPENKDARSGMATIARRYEVAALKKLEEGDVTAARDRISKGLEVEAGNEKLLALQQKIEDDEQAVIDSLLRKAKNAFAAKRYTTPADDCAYRYYNEIKEIRPESKLVERGLRAIADRYATMGDKALQNMNLSKARGYVSSGLKVYPRHQALLELQADLQKSKTAIFFKGIKRSFRPIFN
ncbi:protein kinase domain-containing protein [Desulforhopalus sp. 52FAK]